MWVYVQHAPRKSLVHLIVSCCILIHPLFIDSKDRYVYNYIDTKMYHSPYSYVTILNSAYAISSKIALFIDWLT